MAGFAALDFAGFEEARFWTEYDALCASFPNRGLERFRTAFEMALAGSPGGASYWPVGS